MITVSVSDFKRNIKKYTELSMSQSVIVKRRGGKSFRIVPVEAEEETDAFLESIALAERQIKNGASKKVNSQEELELFLEQL